MADRGIGSKLLRSLLCVAVVLATGSAPAQQKPPAATAPYPHASHGSAEARTGLAARKDWIIRHAACGREDQYLSLLAAERIKQFKDQGEGFINLLGAKVAFLLAHPREACIAPAGASVDMSRPDCHEATLDTSTPPQPAISVSRACLIKQVNDGILLLRKDSVLGSSHLVCLTKPTLDSSGEFDVEVRELVRVLYMGGPNGANILRTDAVDHMYDEMLATRGPPADDDYSQIANCSTPARDEVGSPEDEADSHSFLSGLGHAIGDLFAWLKKSFVIYAVAAVAAPVSLGASAFILIAGVEAVAPTFADVRIPESENHRLNIESSRYLVNADIIARLEAEKHGGIDGVKSDQAKVREWLLRRLQDVAIHDFREYNARPYTRYSLNAVLNLYDFAAVHGDTALQTAAWIVLDLSEAKFAATSNRGRRTSPFRRLADNDGFDPKSQDPTKLYNVVSNADNEVLRAMLLSNQTQLLPMTPLTPAMTPPEEALTRLVTVASSAYALPAPVLVAAADRGAFEQTFLHAGVEHVVQGPAFTITAGGVPTEATASVLTIAKGSDHGIAMPTTIMPTIAGLTLDDIFRFDGAGVDEFKPTIGVNRLANTCVAAGFACGISPWMPKAFGACTRMFSVPGDAQTFINSAACLPDAKPAFWLSARIVDCHDSFCSDGLQWGVMDVMDAPAAATPAADAVAFDAYVSKREAALNAIKPDRRGSATYVTAAGRRIDFTLFHEHPTVLGIDGVPAKPIATAGGIVDADGQGHATIKGMSETIQIDFTDWANPKRTVQPQQPPVAIIKSHEILK